MTQNTCIKILINVFIQVKNSHEDCDYCLRHGIEILSKKHNQLKYCKFLYTFDEVRRLLY